MLVVDDDELLREVARTALEIVGGCEVTTARSGTQAQDKAKTERPDVILLDVMMPGVDGPSTVTALRAESTTRDIPVIFLTGSVNNVVECYDVGADYYLSKPINAKSLIRQLELTFKELAT